jgi:tetratricopeptide (TPR) repeat protein
MEYTFSEPTGLMNAHKDGMKIGNPSAQDDDYLAESYHISVESFVERVENLLRITDHLSSISQHSTIFQQLENAVSLYEERFSHTTFSSIDIDHRITVCMAKTYMKINKFSSAIGLFNKLLLTRLSHDLLLNIGMAYFHLQEFERAGFFFQQIFEKNPFIATNRFLRCE